jgi:hypothetical protein
MMKKLRVYVDTSVIGEAIPGFDCVKLKREIQAQIDTRETRFFFTVKVNISIFH